MPTPRAKRRKKLVDNVTNTEESTASVECSSRSKPSKSYVSKQRKTVSEELSFSNPLESLKYAIEKVRNLPFVPAVHVYTVKTAKGSSLKAVDINQSHSLLACCLNESCDIVIKRWPEKNLPETMDDDLVLKYNSVRVAKESFKNGMSDDSSNPFKILLGHTLPVTGLAFTTQGALLMSSSLDGTVRAWCTEDLKEVKVYFGSREFYCDINVSYDSSYFATSGLDGVASMFVFDREYPVRYFMGHTAHVKCVRFHPNGIYIATASDDKTVKLWSTQSANVVRTFQDDSCPRTITFSPDGKYLASYSGGYIKIYDLASGQLLRTLADSDVESSSHSLCFSRFGEVLASGGVQKKVKLWDVKRLSVENQQISKESSVEDSKASLLKSVFVQRKIHLLKFDQNNFFTCVAS